MERTGIISEGGRRQPDLTKFILMYTIVLIILYTYSNYKLDNYNHIILPLRAVNRKHSFTYTPNPWSCRVGRQFYFPLHKKKIYLVLEFIPKEPDAMNKWCGFTVITCLTYSKIQRPTLGKKKNLSKLHCAYDGGNIANLNFP